MVPCLGGLGSGSLRVFGCFCYIVRMVEVSHKPKWELESSFRRALGFFGKQLLCTTRTFTGIILA